MLFRILDKLTMQLLFGQDIIKQTSPAAYMEVTKPVVPLGMLREERGLIGALYL